MKEKVKLYAEMLFTFIVIAVIVSFSKALVSLGSNIPIKKIITLLIPVVMALIPMIILRIKNNKLSDLGFSRNKLTKQIMIAFGIFAITISFVIVPLLVGINKNDILNFKPSSTSVLVFYIIYLLIFIGFSEEFIFRGYFYKGIQSATNSELKAVIFSSILFGLSHYPNGHNIMQVIMTSVLGLIYGFARYKIKDCTLLSLSIAHGLHDVVILVLSYLLL
ncbi:type II CAAX endopeptidase family protein [Paenibacillus sp. BR2-3]|uniref:CPBP family intramembrane glutamic endopeptidase n=1 Tax=Paenibacillus sp. BR2-3 TaxID=3048494 RepID=UPI00397787A8